MKYLKLFDGTDFNKWKPEYYTDSYNEADKDKFMLWYKKIEPFLLKDDEWGAELYLSNFEENCLVKSDLHSLITHYFLFFKMQKKFDL